MRTFRVPLATFFLPLLLIVSSVAQCTASRQLREHGELIVKIERLNVQSLGRSETPPSGASSCTNIPGSGGTSCPTLSERNFAGHDSQPHHGDPGGAYPTLSVRFGRG
ncbi:hypothetical protein SAY86_007501 [Trapa natans]|uniref:Uncharacterized protein n=1 Tax=Trapa natans TaxID=22666 RepID=A0AAN7LP43_TRANT|nr:hypothetical protein SAY86_007501 [Trapa natans]